MTDTPVAAAPAAPAPAPAPAPSPPPPTAQVIHLGNLLSNFETRIAALETKAKAEVSEVKVLAAKYWPIAAGLLIAASRFVKL